MSLEALKEEILKSANNRREEILKEAREKAEQIINNAKEQAERVIEKKREIIIKELSEKKKAAYAVARLEGKKRLLDRKEEVVQLVFNKAREELIKIKKSEKQYIDILIRYIIEAIKELNIDKANLRVSKDDYDIVKKNLKYMEKEVSNRMNKKVSLELLGEYVNILGGVIVSDDEDKIFYINSFDARLNQIYDNEKNKILNLLFGE